MTTLFILIKPEGLTQTSINNGNDDAKDADGEDVHVTITDHDDFSIDNGYLKIVNQNRKAIQIQKATQTVNQQVNQNRKAIQIQKATQTVSQQANQSQRAIQIQKVTR